MTEIENWTELNAEIKALREAAATVTRERDMWMARCGAAVFALPDHKLCGELQVAADELRARLSAVPSVRTVPYIQCARCGNDKDFLTEPVARKSAEALTNFNLSNPAGPFHGSATATGVSNEGADLSPAPSGPVGLDPLTARSNSIRPGHDAHEGRAVEPVASRETGTNTVKPGGNAP